MKDEEDEEDGELLCDPHTARRHETQRSRRRNASQNPPHPQSYCTAMAKQG